MDGATSLHGSLVNTDENKDARTSAFHLSVVADDLMLSSKYVRSHIPDYLIFNINYLLILINYLILIFITCNSWNSKT